jgi:hypothetical protein
MKSLAYRIRERKHMERSSRIEWLMLAVCIAGALLAVALAWAREEWRGDCYLKTDHGIELGKWRPKENLCTRKWL